MAEKIIQIDSVDAYNKLYGWETLHPLVTIVNHTEEPPVSMNRRQTESHPSSLGDGRGAKEEDDSQVTEPLREEILNGTRRKSLVP